jgi:hypothetical protein
VTLNDNSRVMVVRPASLDDIKQGDYIGLTSVDSDGEPVAISVHIFGGRPTGHRRGPCALGLGQGTEHHDQRDGRRDRGSQLQAGRG